MPPGTNPAPFNVTRPWVASESYVRAPLVTQFTWQSTGQGVEQRGGERLWSPQVRTLGIWRRPSQYWMKDKLNEEWIYLHEMLNFERIDQRIALIIVMQTSLYRNVWNLEMAWHFLHQKLRSDCAHYTLIRLPRLASCQSVQTHLLYHNIKNQ